MPFFIPKLVIGAKALGGVIKAKGAASAATKGAAAMTKAGVSKTGAKANAAAVTRANAAVTAAQTAFKGTGGGLALAGNALGTAAMVGGGVAAYNWDMNRRVNNAVAATGVQPSEGGQVPGSGIVPGAPEFPYGGGGFDFGQGAGGAMPLPGNPSAVGLPQGGMAVAGQGAEITELRRQLVRITDETNALYRAMNDSISLLTDMSVTINAQSDMGQGLQNLANNASELSRQGIQDLTYIINFMDERIRTSETGIAESSATLSGLNSDMNSVNWFN
jgi:hypothetical protein